MDPVANLQEQIALARKILEKFDRAEPIEEEDSIRLAELIVAMAERSR